MTETTTQIMGIDANTLAEADLDAADYYVLADVTRDSDGTYISHGTQRDEYPTIAAAAAALLDQYDGGNVWQDVVTNLPGYDAEMTDRIDPGMRSDRVAFEDGAVVRFEPSLSRWVVADRTASELAADLAD